MRKSMISLAACAALGIAAIASAGDAAAETRQRVKYNFSSARATGKTLISLKKTAVTARKGARSTKRRARVRKARVNKARRGRRVARRGAGYAACKAAARRFGVPMATALAVCRLESGFRCNARGRAGELGLLQIKPATARALGFRGSARKLLSCSVGAYWGMKHLALAIRRGGVWKHNAGLYAKRPNHMARRYARKVAALRRHYR